MTIANEPEIWPASVLLNDVSWDLYQRLLKAVGEGNVRMTYDEGALEIMSPLPEHERIKTFIGQMIGLLALEMDIPIGSLGSTTFKRKSLRKGLEPDECFYLRHERAVRGKKRLDLKRDPPPDLVVEVDVSYRTIDKRQIYAAMRVPEIWNYDRGQLECLHLRRGKYEAQDMSLAFPFLRPAVMEKYLAMLDENDETSILRQWQSWIRNTLLKK